MILEIFSPKIFSSLFGLKILLVYVKMDRSSGLKEKKAHFFQKIGAIRRNRRK
jgi:hypothetical protein